MVVAAAAAVSEASLLKTVFDDQIWVLMCHCFQADSEAVTTETDLEDIKILKNKNVER